MTAERNLLFAVLAFESEFLNLTQLTSACRAWAADKSKPLADLLVERGWITAEDRVFVEKLLERKLAKHQHDPRVTLNSIVRGDVCDAIKEVQDSDIQQSLSSWPSSGPVLVETLIQSEEDKPKSRYTWLSEVGHGGLGKVWLARDNDLAREVALKEVRPDKSSASQEALRRLIKEAQITGQLQHPNIVPVYEMNRGSRPFYTMKLVKGETLAKAIKKHHEQLRAGHADPLSLPRLLNIFANVCEALAYAHSRGIIHRDLKPENIVLGDYGEAIVLDWGLAKQIGGVDEETAPVIVTQDAQSPATHLGATPGTPAYMAPEQAAGRVDLIDQRTDVYGLGSILFEILTGQPPHRSSPVAPRQESRARDQAANDNPTSTPSSADLSRSDRATSLPPLSLHDLLKQICDRETPRARATDPSLPQELDAICGTAMSKRREDRYPDAKSLVADVRRFLSDEPVSACPEPFAVRTRRWVKRHPTLVVSTAATLLISLVSLAAIASVIGQSNRSLATKNSELEQANHRERDATKLADEQRASAVRSRDEAQAVLTFFQDKVLAVARPENQEGGLRINVTIREAIDAAEPLIADAFPDQPLVEASIRNSLGSTYRYLGLAELAIRQHERARDLRENKLGPEHPDTLISMSNLAWGYRDAGKLDLALPLLEQTLELMKVKLGPEHPDTLISMNNLAVGYFDAGKLDLALPLREQTLELMKAKLGPEHPDTLTSMNNLAGVYRAVGKLDLALPLDEQTLELRKAKFGPEHPDTLESMNSLAQGYSAVGKLDLALPLWEQTLELRKAKLGPEHPDTLKSMNNLATGYYAVDKLDLALPLWEKSLELTKAKLGPEHRETHTTMNNLAAGYYAAGKLDLALPLWEQTLQLTKAKFGPEHPDTLTSMNNLAAGLHVAGKFDQALPLLEQTLELVKAKHGADHPDTLISMHNLGVGYIAADKLDLALPLLEQTLDLYKSKLGLDHPGTLSSMNALASTYLSAERLREALGVYQTLLELSRPKLGPEHDTTVRALDGVGTALLKIGDYSGAENYLRECAAIREKKLPDDWALFNTKSRLGAALVGQKRFKEAEPLLVEGYSGMKEREAKIPPTAKTRLTEAIQWLVDLYVAWEKPEEEAKWKATLEKAVPKTESSPNPK